MCNPLLVEETEEDIWKRDYIPVFYGQISTDPGDDNSRLKIYLFIIFISKPIDDFATV